LTQKTIDGGDVTPGMNPVEEHFKRRRHLEKIINVISYEPLGKGGDSEWEVK
jgi:hypothetical protein